MFSRLFPLRVEIKPILPVNRDARKGKKSYSDLYDKCFEKFTCINGNYICMEAQSLGWLDLSFKTCYHNRPWEKAIMPEIIRLLPPFYAEYLTPETRLPEKNALSLLFHELHNDLKKRLQTVQENRLNFAKECFREFQRLTLCGHQMSSLEHMRNAILKYLTTAQLFNMFKAGDEAHFTNIYQSLQMRLHLNFPEDSELLIAMLNTLCTNDELKTFVFVDVLNEDTLKYILCRAQDVGFNFWGLWQGVGRLSVKFNPVAVLFSMWSRNDLAKVLLNYGFQYASDRSVYRYRCRTIYNIRYRSRPIISSENMERLLLRRPRNRMLMVLDIFLTFGNFDDNFDISEEIETLVLISRSQPQPYISPRLLFQSLADLLTPAFHKELIGICINYFNEKIYDCDYRVYRPRTLLHLSRCAIRKVLLENLMLPDGIDELGLEKPLATYLFMEC